MKELIPIAMTLIGGRRIQTVNARDLHAYLGIKQDFESWIEEKIKQQNFKENKDFVCLPASTNESPKGKESN